MVLCKDEYKHLMDIAKSAEQPAKVFPSEDKQAAKSKSKVKDVTVGDYEVQDVPTLKYSLIAQERVCWTSHTPLLPLWMIASVKIVTKEQYDPIWYSLHLLHNIPMCHQLF